MTDHNKTYEGMFLLDSGNPDFHASSEPARTILERNGAEILAFNPWDDRRLAYEIRGRKRGLYVLTYFKAAPEKIAEIERDCRLDERVLRIMLLRHDNLTEEIINAETPATGVARRAAVRREDDDAAAAAAAAAELEAEKKPKRKPPADETDDSTDESPDVLVEDESDDGDEPDDDSADDGEDSDDDDKDKA